VSQRNVQLIKIPNFESGMWPWRGQQHASACSCCTFITTLFSAALSFVLALHYKLSTRSSRLRAWGAVMLRPNARVMTTLSSLAAFCFFFSLVSAQVNAQGTGTSSASASASPTAVIYALQDDYDIPDFFNYWSFYTVSSPFCPSSGRPFLTVPRATILRMVTSSM
jgi:hypothetical protein